MHIIIFRKVEKEFKKIITKNVNKLTVFIVKNGHFALCV